MDIIPNVNPRPTAAAKPTTAAAPATRKPAGPIMEQRKIVAAQKAGMIVDARLYGVKPMELAKYINTMIKPGPYSGYVYNQKMMNLANISLMYTKTISADIKNIAISNEKIKTGIGGAFGKMIGLMQKGNVISEREARDKEAAQQQNKIDPRNDPIYQQTAETNKLLAAIIKDGGTEKGKKGGLGWLSNISGILTGVLPGLLSNPLVMAALGGLVASTVVPWLLSNPAIKNAADKVTEKTLKVASGVSENIIGTPAYSQLERTGARIAQASRNPSIITGLNLVGSAYMSVNDLFNRFTPMGIIGTSAIYFADKKISQGAAILAEKAANDASQQEKYNRTTKSVGQQDITGQPKTEAKKTTAENFLKESGFILSPTGTIIPTGKPLSKDMLPYQSEKPAYQPPFQSPFQQPTPEELLPLTKEQIIKNVNSYTDLIQQEITKHPAVTEALVKGLIAQESGGRKSATSYKYDPETKNYILDEKGNKIPIARGLGQFTAETAKDYGITDPYSPMQSIKGTVEYLDKLLTQFGGDTKAVLSAYNAGPGITNKILKQYNRLPNIPETNAYIPGVLEKSTWFGAAQSPTIDTKSTIDKINEMPSMGAATGLNETNNLLSQVINRLEINTEVTKSMKMKSMTTQTLSPVYA